MSTFIQDVRYGLRGLWRSPGFTCVAVLSLALGVGANTAIFSVVNSVLLRPLPYAEPDRLVMVWEEASFAGFPRNTPAPANYADWKAQNQVFTDMAAIDWRNFNLTGDGEPEKISGYGVTENFFALLGVAPARGRDFLPEEDAPGAGRVAIISHGLWQRRFGGDASTIGRDILLNGEKHTVVGIMPPGFQFIAGEINVWVPIAFAPEELANRGGHYLTVIARLKPGTSPEQAQADVQTVMRGIAHRYPDEVGRVGALVVPLREQLTGDIRRALLVLLVAVGFVLLIACANIANLLLSRAAHRRKEIAVRTALGASRWRIMRQLLTESVLLAVAGGAAGLLVAAWSFAFLRQLIPPGMIMLTDLEIDAQVLGYTLLISTLTGVIFGLAPALQSSRIDFNEALKQGGGRSAAAGTGGGRAGGNWLRNAMVVAEVALTLVLLTGAGLLIRTLFQLQNQYAQLRPESVLTLRTQLPPNKYDTHAKRAAFYEQVLERVKALPGVAAAGYTTTVPLEWKGGTSGFYPEGHLPQPGLSYDANHRQVSADYLPAMGIPLKQGRHFDARLDHAQSMPVVIINETMARQYWPGGEALGKRFKAGDPDSERPWLTIVGIAGDVKQMGAAAPVKAEMYLPYAQVTYQQWFAPRDLVVRTAGGDDPAGLTAAVRREIHAVDPEQPIANIRTMSEILGEEVAPRRTGMQLLGALAGLALLLAALGIYGVLSYFVAQHTPEIGVRLALGAQQRDILALVLKKGLRLALLGVAIGLAASLALTRLMASLLYGVSATDPVTYALIVPLLTAVAIVACLIPARRAMRIEPMTALRYE